MKTIEVYELVYNSTPIGFRLSINFFGTYDFLHAVFKHICASYGIKIVVISRLSVSYSNGKYYTENDTAIEVLDSWLIKLLLNDLGKINLNLVSATGKSLTKFISKVSSFQERYCMQDIIKFLQSGNCNILTLYGVRRTGKTVLLYQTIKKLQQSGVDLNDIYFLSVMKNGIDSDSLYEIVEAILSSGIKYLFIDEITYCKGNIDFTSVFAEKYVDKKVILTGTDSAVFINPLDTFLYDRVELIHTSYISYKEFNHLYNLGIKEYISSGGVLRNNSRDYKSGVVYFKISVIDNMFNSFDKYDLFDYPELLELYYTDKNILRSMLIKWLQNYGSKLSLRLLNRVFKSDDIGNLKDVLQRHSDYSASDIVKFTKDFEKAFISNIKYKDITDFTESQIVELKDFLERIDCLVKINSINSEFLIPLLLRYSLYLKAVDTLNSISSDVFDINLLKSIMQNTIEGILYESIVYTDLHKAGVGFRKYRDKNNREIDLIIGSDYYEIKHSDKISAGQCRWLLNNEVVKNYSSLNVIYSGNNKIVEFSQRDAVEDIIKSKVKHNKSLDLEYENADTVKKQINYINIHDFLLSI
jgi:predicted AAA+ superfamily ATPase